MVNEFKDFCDLLENIGSPLEARLEIAAYLRYMEPSDQVIACNFLLGKPIEKTKIGFSKKTIENVLIERYGMEWKTTKSLGDIFLRVSESKHPKSFLHLQDIYDKYNTLSYITSYKERELYLRILDLPNIQKKYFIDIMLDKLQARIGFGVIKYSLAMIYDVPVSDVEYAYNITKSMTKTIGFLNGAELSFEIGEPISPQLARDVSKFI